MILMSMCSSWNWRCMDIWILIKSSGGLAEKTIILLTSYMQVLCTELMNDYLFCFYINPPHLQFPVYLHIHIYLIDLINIHAYVL